MIKVRGDDLRLDLAIGFHEAIFGGIKKIDFSHLETGSGGNLVQVKTSLEIMIPAGANHGTKLRVDRQGDAGKNGGETGDLYIFLHVPSQSNEFNRCDINIESEIKITPEQARTGCDFLVKMLEGEKKIAISAGTRDGDFLSLKGRGVPKLGIPSERGDHIIHFRVESELDFGDVWQ
jgi:molecular chaperone DnaJ